MHKNENSQVLPALEELKRRIEAAPLAGRERLEMLVALGYFQKQRLCDLDRRDPEDKIRRSWMGFERRFGHSAVLEDFRRNHPGWTCLRDFFRPRRQVQPRAGAALRARPWGGLWTVRAHEPIPEPLEAAENYQIKEQLRNFLAGGQ